MNILVISNDDKTWLLPAWSEFTKKYGAGNQISFILLPDHLGKYNKVQSIKWAYNAFGIKQAFSLSIFSMLKLLKNFRSSHRVSSKADRLQKFNSSQILEIIQNKNIDLVILTCSYIIPADLLENSGILWINKHSSILPNSKGLFPYIWGRIYGFSLGVTFHLVSKEIDQGEVLFQKRARKLGSMVEFYSEIYEEFSENCNKAIQIALEQSPRVLISSADPNTYFSIPSKDDVSMFFKAGGKIVTLKDFFLLLK